MVQVKICGITNLDDALVAVKAGADMLGLVFFPQSPRYIEPERARGIAMALQERGQTPRLVGVFVNESLERVCEIAARVRLDMVQLHGDESPEIVKELGCPSSPALLPAGDGIKIVKALRLRDDAEAESHIARYRVAANGNIPAFIVDAFDARRFGGTGTRADWSIAAQVAREFPILLAGGLNTENVAEAIRAVRPWGVDVSSGVERAPGLKDHNKVRQFHSSRKRISHPCTLKVWHSTRTTIRHEIIVLSNCAPVQAMTYEQTEHYQVYASFMRNKNTHPKTIEAK